LNPIPLKSKKHNQRKYKMNNELIKTLENFKGKNILVVGDIMLDKYIFGKVDRISPEAPVQVLEVEKEEYTPGGAANVANNIASLQANASIVGTVGNDNEANILLNELKKRNINTEGIFTDKNKPTTRKVRILGHKQQLLRIDYEKKEYINKEIENNILNFIKNTTNIDAIIISDYAKGVITKNLIENIKTIAQNKIIIVDPKPKHKDLYKNVTLITPNLKEAKEMTDKEENLINELNSPILVTKGENGMSLLEKDGNITNIPTKAKEVYDVSGAGDTVVATLALALSSNATLKQAATLANHAAGITVGKIGTSTVTIEEIRNSIENE
jgi:D-beta-D-heptose 7-phosphate kinase/D-beta-D-heptose 1-phosphate adenosyltransferase